MGICFSIEEKHVSLSDSKPKPNSTGSVGNESTAPTTLLGGGTGSMNIKELREGAGYSNVHIFTYNELRLSTKQFRPDFILKRLKLLLLTLHLS
ncbi:probable serine/threonine-protein kinase PBL17 [Lathyrus oleraceus]|uniref:Uncharacterized protein n=1 Tax=Pisum sativum TaxID=3888 RepID=A0A9D4Y992_PEA|nr:probable serine/threonine-protein kinase PBL17 [Pisum sativum]XP_050909232.1 probable serine/threonine-protein kinase PBL17 [Pisum sativum]KAI5433210.1 hypothetical protein KIW84_020479 [Pisum sativum]KAI5436803.1 hypothetical protein KIW84_023067 [Pisum sativum]